MIDSSYLKSLFPEFSSENDSRVELFIGIAASQIGSDAWGTLTDPATAYLAAHSLAMANRLGSGAAGPVTAEKVGDLSRNYGDLSSKLDSVELSSTPYGLEYLRMRRQVLVTPMVTC